MPLFQSSDVILLDTSQGRRASLRLALAPGYYITAPLALKNQRFQDYLTNRFLDDLQYVDEKAAKPSNDGDEDEAKTPHHSASRAHAGVEFDNIERTTTLGFAAKSSFEVWRVRHQIRSGWNVHPSGQGLART